MHDLDHILVPVTATPADASLAGYAGLVARSTGARKVTFVHVATPGRGTAPVDLAALEAFVRGQVGTLPAATALACEVLHGPLEDRLLAWAAANKSDLIMVGHRRDQPTRRMLARRLAMKAPCSVWMIPEGTPAAIRRLLVPIDFSTHSADSMRSAIALASRLGHPELLALHVYFNEAVATYQDYDQVLRGQEQAAFDSFIAPIDCGSVRVVPVFEEGAIVAHVIGRVADREGADLIVMGTRGRSPSATVLLGSVTDETLADSRLPLLAVKHFGAQMGLLEVLLAKTFGSEGSAQSVKFD